MIIRTVLGVVFNRWFLAGALLLFSLVWFRHGEELFPDPEREAERTLQDLLGRHPELRDIMAPIAEQRRRSMHAAVLSARGDVSPHAALTKLARDAQATRRMPYQARLVELVNIREMAFDPERRDQYLYSHATTCQMLFETADPQRVDVYLGHLEQASKDLEIWEMVYDDPIALLLWIHEIPLDHLRFYKNNRDWLQDSLLDMDPSATDDTGSMKQYLSLIATAYRFPDTAKSIVSEYEMGGPGLAILSIHGQLIKLAVERHGIPGPHVAAVLYANPERFPQHELTPSKAEERAQYLASLRNDHPSVWHAAMSMPLALQLHEDAPDLAENILSKYGADDITILIYAYTGASGADDPHPQARTIVRRICESLDRWGDVTIAILAGYFDYRRDNIVAMLLDNEVGLRTIPFIIRFLKDETSLSDEPFNRYASDKRWADRYFDQNGDPRESHWDWMQHIPGGALGMVVKNWMNGHPNEWSELGWAAMDVGVVAFSIATLGKGAPVAVAARAAASVARVAASTGRRAAQSAYRLTARVISRQQFIQTARLSRIAQSSRVLRGTSSTVRLAGSVIIGSYRVARASLVAVGQSVGAAINTWRSLDTARRLSMLRGARAAMLASVVLFRTIPNIDQVARGMGHLAADIATGTAKAAATLIAGSLDRLVGAVNSAFLRLFLRWVPVFIMLLLAIWLCFRMRSRKSNNVQLA